MMRPILIAAAAVVMATPALAQVKAGDLTFSRMAVRASLGANLNTAAYLEIANAGGKPDRLIGAACTCAARVEAHQTMTHGGVSHMSPAGPLVVPAKGSLSFRPGGLHLMVTGLKAPLKDGAVQEITFRFERAGAVRVRFPVSARIPAAAHRSR